MIVREMTGHTNRACSIAWSSKMFSTGSRDKSILHRDLRSKYNYIARSIGHKQEVCGLKWSYDETQLASGGNDNKLFIWNAQNISRAQASFKDHLAAVKAIAWSPH